ncbi:tyrosine-type recombinase/integrase [Acrocarpospora macrocephala]|uniref:Integrase n=1 Tax=Acrocarpospora macrocephala TaxID=150177 RepID=A0A5M3WY70_9ACTN|nr:tyrosine-type recombinase/integrase [Acrocarpospora macrocephala]GES12849.1 integrase [Acrocarpospora macrocephala]
MTGLAPIMEAFFTDRLMTQQGASPHTIASYRDTFKLLLGYLHARTGKLPARLDLTDLNAAVIGDFLQHLETDRGNSAASRNTRLAAIHSLFRYASLQAPQHANLISRVLAIQTKRTTTTIVTYLSRTELDALLTAPDRTTWHGRRDHALLVLAAQTGLRVCELTGLTIAALHLGTAAHVYCRGKGRKDRCTPLTTHTKQILSGWLDERRPAADTDPLFCTRPGGALSHDAVERLIKKHVAAAAESCPSLQAKTVTPHTLRHTAAMELLHAGVDITVIALWLGHESPTTTRIYLHADMALKEKALARTTPPSTTPGRYQAPDTLLAFLDQL